MTWRLCIVQGFVDSINRNSSMSSVSIFGPIKSKSKALQTVGSGHIPELSLDPKRSAQDGERHREMGEQ